MILSRAPLRVSFFGGGSDLPAFYRKSKNGGVVLSTAIDKFMYLVLIDTPKDHIKLMYSEIEIVHGANNIKHDIVKNVLNQYNVQGNIEIGSFSDIPTIGTGLGSSSTFAVALINGIEHLRRDGSISKQKLAEAACEVEITLCGKPIGKQDQYAAAYGGTNLIEFRTDDSVDITPVDSVFLQYLNDNLMLFYTDKTRSANDILAKQSKAMDETSKFKLVEEMASMTYTAYEHLNEYELDSFGDLLDQSWMLKKQITKGISDSTFDDIYDTAKKNGALGGKLLGAGGGGYFLFYVPEERQERVAKSLSLQQMKFNIGAEGAEIVYDAYTGVFYE